MKKEELQKSRAIKYYLIEDNMKFYIIEAQKVNDAMEVVGVTNKQQILFSWDVLERVEDMVRSYKNDYIFLKGRYKNIPNEELTIIYDTALENSDFRGEITYSELLPLIIEHGKL